MDMFKKSVITWKLDGKRVPAGTAGAEKTVTETDKWYAKLNGKHVALSPDKDVARKMLKKLSGDAALRSIGLVDPYAEQRFKSLTEHLCDYESILAGKGSGQSHIKNTIARIVAIIAGCEFEVTTDIDHGKVSSWLTEQRKPRPMIELPKNVEQFTPSQAAAIFNISVTGLSSIVKRHRLPATGHGKARRLPRATMEAIAERMAQGTSIETTNSYIRAIRGFTRWMARSSRIQCNPLEMLALLNSEVDIKHARRELTIDELRRLLDATRQSLRSYRGLTGEDRSMLYLAAVATGFRARALASLTGASFDLRGDMPVAILPARFNKSKKPKNQPLPLEAATVLASYLRQKPMSKPVWGTSWLGNGAQMIRLDLEAVGIPYVVEGQHGPEYADFHALRHSYLTLLGRSGVDLGTAQVLAGHSSPVLTARYTHRRGDELASAVARLPMLTLGGESRGRGKNGGSKSGRSYEMPENKGDSSGNQLIPRLFAADSRPAGTAAATKCHKMTDSDKTSVFTGVLPFAGCKGKAGVQCQQMTGNASKVLPLGEALGKPGGSFSPDLARIVAAWPALPRKMKLALTALPSLPEHTKQTIYTIIDAAKPRRKAG